MHARKPWCMKMHADGFQCLHETRARTNMQTCTNRFPIRATHMPLRPQVVRKPAGSHGPDVSPQYEFQLLARPADPGGEP